jgi:hypothetical protein
MTRLITALPNWDNETLVWPIPQAELAKQPRLEAMTKAEEHAVPPKVHTLKRPGAQPGLNCL